VPAEKDLEGSGTLDDVHEVDVIREVEHSAVLVRAELIVVVEVLVVGDQAMERLM
jgi:hypothetical protein